MSDVVRDDGDWLSRTKDHLGGIRDRRGAPAGFGAMADELAQAAEEAGASRILFDLSETALIVDNDARFSDCGQVDDDHRRCRWKSTGKPSCDWHHLARISAGQVDDREEATGGFGAGFLAVYRVTDRPEVMSGRHWELHQERRDSDRRIQICCAGGCDRCGLVEGTRFVLPFATDPNSHLRLGLGQDALTWRELPMLQEALVEAAPRALLFKRHLRGIEVRRDGLTIASVERLTEPDGPVSVELISGDGVDETWYLLEGDFREKGDVLKTRLGPERIERARHTRVRVAVPSSGTISGRLFAGVPTGTGTRLPVHIDASFFPSTDRTGINVQQGDYRSAWNEAALDRAAHVLANNLLVLRDRLGPVALWSLILAVHGARKAGSAIGAPDVARFWSYLAERIAEAPVAWNVDEKWTRPSLAPVLRTDHEVASVGVLRSLGIIPMHPDVRPVVAQGLVANELGTRWLTLDTLVGALAQARLTGIGQRHLAPPQLTTDRGLRELWDEIDVLMTTARSMQQLRPELMDQLLQRSIAPTVDGLLVRPRSAYRADRETRRLVAGLEGMVLLDEAFEEGGWALLRECPRVSVETVVSALERTGTQGIAARVRDGRYDPSLLLPWLAERLGELSGQPALIDRIRRLVVFPAGQGLVQLDALAMPADAGDPAGSSELLLPPELRGHGAVLEALGIRRLTIAEFVRGQVAAVFATAAPDPDGIRRTIRFLADHLGELADDDETRAALRLLPVIECGDATFHRPTDAVQQSAVAEAVLGEDGPVALLPVDAPSLHQGVWEWLGVPQWPTSGQVERRIRQLVERSRAQDAIGPMEAVCRYLNDRRDEPTFAALIARLRDVEWLPARDRRGWFRPTALFAVLEKDLFETQATFLSLSPQVQGQIPALLDLLGIRTSPPTSMVVDHLLTCAAHERPVNLRVWQALAQNVDDPSIQRLRDRACIPVADRYRIPHHLVWGGSTLGSTRIVLGPDMQRYRPLLDAIGVRDRATARDAAEVLREMAASASAKPEEPVDPAMAAAVRACWTLLGQELASDEPAEAMAVLPTLGTIAAALDRDGVACRPERLYLEDRPQLPDRFPAGVRARVVDLDPATADALRLAGARDFSSVIDIVKLDGRPDPAPWLEDRLHERWHSLQRVMLAAGVTPQPLARLDAFERYEGSGLLVRYELNVEPDHPVTEPERPEAIYIPSERALYVRGPQESSWRACARELSVALCGLRDSAKVAAGFLEVLRAMSAGDAEQALDELGVARLSQAPDGSAATAADDGDADGGN